MLQGFISFREAVWDVIEVASKEIFIWEKFTVFSKHEHKKSIYIFVAEASQLAQAMLTSLLFYGLVLQP